MHYDQISCTYGQFYRKYAIFCIFAFCIRNTLKSMIFSDSLRRRAHKSKNTLDTDLKFCRNMRNMRKLKVIKYKIQRDKRLRYAFRYIQGDANLHPPPG